MGARDGCRELELGERRRREPQHTRGLLDGFVVVRDADHPRARAKRRKPGNEARLRAAAAGAVEDGVELDAERVRLRDDLGGAGDVAEAAETMLGGTTRDQ